VWAVSDDALLDGLATGDPDCAAAFVARFQRRVYGLAYSVLQDARAAEDIAQEAFERAWKRAESFDARRGTVAAWLLTITRNLAVDAARLRRAVVLDPEAMLALDSGSTDRLPEEQALLSTESDRVRNVLRQLPEEQRRALLLAAFHGRTAKEIAELEDIPLGTAKTRIRTALVRVRASLVQEESGE
jgi:RNA polymerase sigma-70 factor (ECF subfamily)